MEKVEPSILNPEELAEYGLSNYEAKVYYAILPLGVMTAKEISEVSMIPFGRIYDTLTRLEEKGVIESQDTRPKKYSAKDPKIALKNLLESKEVELLKLKDGAPTIEEKLAQIYLGQSNESLFWNVALESEAIAKHSQKVLETQEELLIYFNVSKGGKWNAQKAFMSFLDGLKEILSRGASIKFLFGGVDEEDFKGKMQQLPGEYSDLLENIELGITPIITNTFDVIDTEKVIIKIINPVNEDEYLALIYLWQSSFASKMKEKFLQMWQLAKKMQITRKVEKIKE